MAGFCSLGSLFLQKDTLFNMFWVMEQTHTVYFSALDKNAHSFSLWKLTVHQNHVDNNVKLRACLHGGGGPQIGEVTCGGSPHLSCKRDQIKVRDYMDRRVTPPKRVTSPTWGPPPRCKQALKNTPYVYCLRFFIINETKPVLFYHISQYARCDSSISRAANFDNLYSCARDLKKYNEHLPYLYLN